MKKFKKIYIEITNICNLKCDFCSIDDVIKKEMTLIEFEEVIKKINDYTDYIYLHVKGEPLMHSDIKGIIDISKKYNKHVNITTNGTLLKNKLNDLTNIRQINISLQSIIDVNIIDDIFYCTDILSKKVFINYRLWAKNNLYEVIKGKLLKKYNSLDSKLSENVFLSLDKEFVWPSLSNEIIRTTGTCYGTRDHIAILVDGTVVPCCLDSKGIINLGNIFRDEMEDILNSSRYNKMKSGFENNVLHEELCKKCGFIE